LEARYADQKKSWGVQKREKRNGKKKKKTRGERVDRDPWSQLTYHALSSWYRRGGTLRKKEAKLIGKKSMWTKEEEERRKKRDCMRIKCQFAKTTNYSIFPVRAKRFEAWEEPKKERREKRTVNARFKSKDGARA